LFIVVEGFWCNAPFAFYFLCGLLLSTGWTCGRTLPCVFTCIFFSVLVLWIFKEALVLVFWIFQNQRTISSSSLKESELKNCQSQLFQNTYRRCGFHERTNNEPVVFWLVIWFFHSLRTAKPGPGLWFFENHGYESYEPLWQLLGGLFLCF
jgi:hypothetical protein